MVTQWSFFRSKSMTLLYKMCLGAHIFFSCTYILTRSRSMRRHVPNIHKFSWHINFPSVSVGFGIIVSWFPDVSYKHNQVQGLCSMYVTCMGWPIGFLCYFLYYSVFTFWWRWYYKFWFPESGILLPFKSFSSATLLTPNSSVSMLQLPSPLS